MFLNTNRGGIRCHLFKTNVLYMELQTLLSIYQNRLISNRYLYTCSSFRIFVEIHLEGYTTQQLSQDSLIFEEGPEKNTIIRRDTRTLFLTFPIRHTEAGGPREDDKVSSNEGRISYF